LGYSSLKKCAVAVLCQTFLPKLASKINCNKTRIYLFPVPYKHNPTEYAKQIEAETLLLYGAKDNRVTKSEIDEIYRNLKGKKKFHQFKTLGHENYLKNGKGKWLEIVTGFLD
jgi:pimeloyl-ACP methyl ester carboxylesterase